jgi:hypothetical protein
MSDSVYKSFIGKLGPQSMLTLPVAVAASGFYVSFPEDELPASGKVCDQYPLVQFLGADQIKN